MRAIPATKEVGPIGDCDRFASPSGSNRNSGVAGRPVRTVRRLASTLGRNETGCLRPGLYPSTSLIRLRAPGSALLGLGRARVRGPIRITPGADGAAVVHLILTSRKPGFPEPLKIAADHAVVTRNRIFGSSSTNCIIVGSTRAVRGARIERNRIHHCGRAGKLTHLIYVARSRDSVIRQNVLTDNRGGWAVHLYPDADRTLVEQNVIDHNLGGVIFAGEGGDTSDDNVVRNNVIANSGPRFNIEGSWSGGAPGTGNWVISNCLFTRGPNGPAGIGPPEGFITLFDNVTARSPFQGLKRGNYRLSGRSGCSVAIRTGTLRAGAGAR